MTLPARAVMVAGPAVGELIDTVAMPDALVVALDALRLPRVVRKSIVWPGWTSPLSR